VNKDQHHHADTERPPIQACVRPHAEQHRAGRQEQLPNDDEDLYFAQKRQNDAAPLQERERYRREDSPDAALLLLLLKKRA
jgi:hypothetical protein